MYIYVMLLRVIFSLLSLLIFASSIWSTNMVELAESEKIESTILMDVEVDKDVELELDDLIQMEVSIVTISKTLNPILLTHQKTCADKHELNPPPELS